MQINNLFASRDSLEGALEYALSVVGTLQAAERFSSPDKLAAPLTELRKVGKEKG